MPASASETPSGKTPVSKVGLLAILGSAVVAVGLVLQLVQPIPEILRSIGEAINEFRGLVEPSHVETPHPPPTCSFSDWWEDDKC
jgi:hypothetical protein